MNYHRIIACLIILLFLISCTESPTPGITSTPGATSEPSSTPPPTEEFSPTPAGPATLRIWLPPHLDPASGTAAGDILQARLDEFVDRRPDLQQGRLVAVVAALYFLFWGVKAIQFHGIARFLGMKGGQRQHSRAYFWEFT